MVADSELIGLVSFALISVMADFALLGTRENHSSSV